MTKHKNHQWVVDFSNIFFQKIYHYDAKRTFLDGTKDYNLYKDVIKLFIEGITSNSIDHLLEELNKILETVSKNYLNSLLLRFSDKYDTTEYNELIDSAEKAEYQSVITEIETKFDFSFDIRIKNLYPNMDETYNPQDLTVDSLEHLKKVFYDYLEAQNLLFDFCAKYDSCHERNEFQDDEDYIMIVIYSEFWNFLSHYSFSNTFRTTIKNYEKNIERAARHLERAILDIYKYILIKGEYVDEKVLSLRVNELLSFGDSTKISCIYQDYKNILKNKLSQNTKI